MRNFYYKTISAVVIITLCCYTVLVKMALLSMPLDPELAYEALRAELQRTEAGRHALSFSSPTMMQREKELLFFGQGRVRLSSQNSSGVPLIENYDFQYIAVVGRVCEILQSKCYKSSDLEVSGKKSAAPMI